MISVIVPVYNAELWLSHCIDSILAQTYNDFELLLVDDCSTDNSAEICKNYCVCDSRCKFLSHQHNKGAALTRNTGLHAAKGDYIAFMDADDWIHPRCFEYMFRAIKEYDSLFCMVSSSIGKREQNSPPLLCRDVVYSTRIIDREELINSLFCFNTRDPKLANYIYNTVWGKLYHRDLLDGLYFKDRIDHDTEYNYQVYQRIKQAVVVEEELHYYLIRGNSLSYNPQPSKITTFFDSTILALDYIPASMPKDRGAKLLQLYKRILLIRYRVIREKKYHPYLSEFFPIMKQVAKDYWKEFLKNDHIAIPTKISILVFYYIPPLYNLFRWLMKTKQVINLRNRS